MRRDQENDGGDECRQHGDSRRVQRQGKRTIRTHLDRAVRSVPAAESVQFWRVEGKLEIGPKIIDRLPALQVGIFGQGNELQDNRRANLAAGRAVGVTGTPAFFVNGIPLKGAQPVEAFSEIIEEELAAAG